MKREIPEGIRVEIERARRNLRRAKTTRDRAPRAPVAHEEALTDALEYDEAHRGDEA